jgi:hypothetical protein
MSQVLVQLDELTGLEQQKYLAYFNRYLYSKYECIHHIMKKTSRRCFISDRCVRFKKHAKVRDVNPRSVFVCSDTGEETKRTPMLCLAVTAESPPFIQYINRAPGNNCRIAM